MDRAHRSGSWPRVVARSSCCCGRLEWAAPVQGDEVVTEGVGDRYAGQVESGVLVVAGAGQRPGRPDVLGPHGVLPWPVHGAGVGEVAAGGGALDVPRPAAEL